MTFSSIHAYEHGRPAVKSRENLIIDETVTDLSDVTDPQNRAVQPRQQGNILEILAYPALGNGVQDDAARIRTQFTERDVEGFALHRVRNLADREFVSAQCLLVHLDRDLPVSGTAKLHLRHARQQQEFATHPLRSDSQLIFGQAGRRHRKRHHFMRYLLQSRLWLLGAGRRESLDAVDSVLDIQEHRRGTRKRCDLNVYAPEAMRSRCHHSFHPRQSEDVFFYPAIDVFFDFLWRRSR